MTTKIANISLQIDGMICVSCENRIENTLRKAKGIEGVKVSYSNSRASITYDANMIDQTRIETIIESLDYKIKKPLVKIAALKNRLKLCKRFLVTLEKCKLPELTQLWNFYEYQFLISNITLELCDASDIEVENDEIKTMSVTIEHQLLDIETELLSVEKFADLHQVNVDTV